MDDDIRDYYDYGCRHQLTTAAAATAWQHGDEINHSVLVRKVNRPSCCVCVTIVLRIFVTVGVPVCALSMLVILSGVDVSIACGPPLSPPTPCTYVGLCYQWIDDGMNELN